MIKCKILWKEVNKLDTVNHLKTKSLDKLEVISEDNLKKLYDLNNEKVLRVVYEFIELCNPSKVTVITDSKEDINYVRKRAIELGEEMDLATRGHTVHFDGFFTMDYHDQARDKRNTKVLVPKGEYMSQWINSIDRDEGLEEVLHIMRDCMSGHECVVRFFSLGPKNSKFSILALQLTDSFYVAHSEDILYREGYEEFKNLDGSEDFFYFIHSSGELTGNPPVTKNLDKRRIYIDLEEQRVLSVNNQYAGNSLGLKKLALRLAIHKANNEDWLAEHYFILGIHPKGKKRVSYFCGAYPSACGKTSTAMLPGQTIVGDDIAYLRPWEDGYAHAVNIERGLFGIIKDVNPKDDPIIYEAITSPRETIFSNVLVTQGFPYWIGMGKAIPRKGINYSGKWHTGKTDENGKQIPHAHPNARYTIRINELANADVNLDSPEGVPVEGIFYGGRDSDTMPPILESLDWEHGVFLGASIESETTSATLGAEGVRTASPMANLDFVVVPLGKYLDNHRKFGEDLSICPRVFATNYFLKNGNGKYLNGMLDKLVWVMWAESRSHNELQAIETPIGFIPRYHDLRALFQKYLKKDYSKKDYIQQFSIRTRHLLEKLDRVEAMYKKDRDIPEFFWKILEDQRKRLIELRKSFGKEQISPFEFK
ncbi:MAG: phosphoenolpyruvate carboxykinase (GTP) [Promethearchaeota archaeon]|nr:MAG: phosphoenolpyruvate carboxykinase (GTP) [Candidatus Lokiarchaeota archaeon]